VRASILNARRCSGAAVLLRSASATTVRTLFLYVDRERGPQVLGTIEEAAPAPHVQIVGERHADRATDREHFLEQAAQHDERMRRPAHLAKREAGDRTGRRERLDADELRPEKLRCARGHRRGYPGRSESRRDFLRKRCVRRAQRRERKAARVGMNLDFAEPTAIRVHDCGARQYAPVREQRCHHFRRSETVLHGDVDALAVVVRRQAFERVVEVGHLGAEDDDRMRPGRDRIADEAVAVDLYGAVGAVQQKPQATIAQETFRPDSERDMPACRMQARAEHSTYRARAYDKDAAF
jgi:hypothetical protein